MKPSQRKIFWTATNHAKKFTKTAALCGQVIVEADYHHGDSSLQDAASLMAAPWANNLPLLEGEGNFGSRIVQVPAAARYTSVRVNPAALPIFLDSEDCRQSPDGNEPSFFLPILPVVAINGASGMAVGFATDIFPRSISSIKDFVLEILGGLSEEKARATHIKPSFPQFFGSVKPFEENGRTSWIVSGKIERDKKRIIVTELPYGYDREGYIEKLEKLIEKGVINDYTDETSGGRFRFSLKVPSSLEKKDDGQILADLKLVVKMTENIVVISPDGKVNTYPTIGSLVWDFVQYRLTVYPKRFARELAALNQDFIFLKMKRRLVEAVGLSPHDYFNLRTTKAKLRDQFGGTLRSEGFQTEEIESNMDRLVNLPVYQFTNEVLQETEKKIKELEKEIKRISGLKPEKEFAADLAKIA
jgi:DNA gyrase/topoisomerase IV subunit A